MRQQFKPLKSVAASYSSVYEVQIDGGKVIDEIQLTVDGILSSQLGLVEVLLNGTAIYSAPASHFKNIHAANGKSAEAGVYRIPFKDLTLNTDLGQNLTGLATYTTDEILLRVDVGAIVQAQIDANTIPTIKGLAVLSPKRNREFIPMIKRSNIEGGVSGENDIGRIRQGSRIRQVWFEDAGRITALRIERDGTDITKVSRTDYERQYKHYEKVLVDGWFIFSPIMTDFAMHDMLETASAPVNFFPTISAAGAMNIIVHDVVTASNPRIDPIAYLEAQRQAQMA